jgi:hypothetical protein
MFARLAAERETVSQTNNAMLTKPLIFGTAILVILDSDIGALVIRAQGERLVFSCSTFPPDSNEAALRARFGVANVTSGRVPWGGAEGDYNEGTVLFAEDTSARVEILWKERTARRTPEWVSVRGDLSRWRTAGGVTLGTDLLTIEKLNRRPFRLVGFGSDVSGTVLSWSTGQLELQDTNHCRVRVRLGLHVRPEQQDFIRLRSQLVGEREYSSGHPAMQALDPAVYELFLQYNSPGN